MRTAIGVLLCLALPFPAAPATAQLAGVAGTELIVPVFAKSTGANGASYVTSLTIDSDLPPPVELSIRLHPRGLEPLDVPVTATAFPFTWSTSGVDGLPSGSGWLRLTASRPVRVTSTTAHAVLAGVPPGAALAAGESTSLGSALSAFSSIEGTRYNFGLAEVGGAAATVTACVDGAYVVSNGPAFVNGTFRSCRPLAVLPLGSVQVNGLDGFANLPPRAYVTAAELTIAGTEGTGRVVSWATTVGPDNVATAHEPLPPAGLSAALGAAPATLLATKTGSGTGTIRLLSGEALCAEPCQAIAVTLGSSPPTPLEAVPGAASLFAGWTGCDSTDGPSCSLAGRQARRVTASFPLSLLTVDVFGFLDATVTAGSRTTTCPGPDRRCAVPIAPGAPIAVTAAPWPGVPATDTLRFSGPGCGASGCTLATAPDPTVTGVELRSAGGDRILYVGAYPPTVRRGEAVTILVKTSGCTLTEGLMAGPEVTRLGPGVYWTVPQATRRYEYDCYYSLSGSTRRDLERAWVTVTVTDP